VVQKMAEALGLDAATLLLQASVAASSTA
jgi:hypothetical protein